MKLARTIPTIAAATVVGGGLLAASVPGDDGSVGVGERLAGPFPPPVSQLAAPAQPGSAAAARRRTRRPRVLHGVGQPVALAAGGTGAIALRCPRRFKVPISAGIESSIPGIFAGRLTRAPDTPRAMVVGAVNTTDTSGEWTATIVCMRGAAEA